MAWCLDFHASYRCRHAGACCRAGWTIPFEDGSVAARTPHDACSFFDASSHLCAIHHALGPQALPLTCRMFPRIVLKDDRGTFISLSHFCPTAAGLLFRDISEAVIVDAPPALTGVGELDGLDARGAWPPLLRSGVLMNLESYATWERRSISVLTRDDARPPDALAAVEEATARIARWTPGSADLLATVHASFDALGDAAPAAIDRDAFAVKRWLSARLFGAWAAYQGRDGLPAIPAYLRNCLDTFTREAGAGDSSLEAIRRSDLLIMHGAATHE